MGQETIEAVDLKYNVARAQASIESLEDSLGRLEQANIDLKVRQKELQQELSKTGKFTQDQAKEYAVNKIRIQEQNKEIRETSKSYKAQQIILAENSSGIRGLNDLMTDEIKGRKNQRQAIAQLAQVQNEWTDTSELGQKQLGLIVDRMEELQGELDKTSTKTQLGKDHVGQYTQGIQNAANNLQVFGVGLGDISGKVMDVGKSTTAGSKGWNILRLAAMGFVAVPIIAVLFGIVSAFKSTQEGMDRMNRVIKQGEAVLQVVTGRMNTFGRAIQAFSDGNFAAGFDLIRDSVSGVAEEIVNATAAASRFEKIKQSYEAVNIAVEEQLIALDDLRQRYDLVANDSTISLLEQEEATKKAAKVAIEAADERLAIEERNFQVIYQELNAKRINENRKLTNEEKKQLNEAKRAVQEAEFAKFEATETNAQLRRQIQSDLIEQELDVLIDGFDNVLQINTRKLKNEEATFAERMEILDETAKLSEKSLEDQVKALEKAAKQQIDIDDLLKESDSSVLKEKIKNTGLSEILSNRLLEVIRERRLAEQDFSELYMELSKQRLEQNRKEMEAQAQQFKESAEQLIREEDRKWATEEANRTAAFLREQQDEANRFASLKTQRLAEVDFREELERDRLDHERRQRIAAANIEIQDENERADEKRRIEAEYQRDILQLELDAGVDRNEIRRQALEDFGNLVQDSANTVLGSLDTFNQLELENDLSKLDEKKARTISYYDDLLSKVEDGSEEQQKLEKEKADAIQKIEEEADQLRLKAEIDRLKIARIGVIADGIALVAKTLATVPFPLNIPLGVLAAAQAGLQLRNINSQLRALGAQGGGYDFISAGAEHMSADEVLAENLQFDEDFVESVDNLDNVGEVDVQFNPDSLQGRLLKLGEDLGEGSAEWQRGLELYEAFVLALGDPEEVGTDKYNAGLTLSRFLNSHGYALGTDFLEGPGTGTSDSIPIWASRGEMIFTNDQRMQMGGKSREDIIQDVLFADTVRRELLINNNFQDSRMVDAIKEVGGKLDQINPTAVFANIQQTEHGTHRMRVMGKYRMKKYGRR